ncbi:MAG TPA: hypothetical protein VGJ90_12905 [Methylophilaceae bacterium]
MAHLDIFGHKAYASHVKNSNMPSPNSTDKYAVCRYLLWVLKTLCLVFLLTWLYACQHQTTKQVSNPAKQATKVQQDPATHLPQAKPLTSEERTAAMQASNMAKIKQDKYLSAFLFSGFEETPPNTPDINKAEAAPTPTVESEPATIEASHLVSVEVWSIILGEEKISLLAKAQNLGATQLPPPREWHEWRMAIGSLEGLGFNREGLDRDGLETKSNNESDAKKTILFIAPPDFAKFKNGDHVIVEILNSGGVHIARYMK